MKRSNKNVGAVHDVYAGTKRTGTVTVARDGYIAHLANEPKATVLGTFRSEAEANRAIFDAVKSRCAS